MQQPGQRYAASSLGGCQCQFPPPPSSWRRPSLGQRQHGLGLLVGGSLCHVGGHVLAFFAIVVLACVVIVEVVVIFVVVGRVIVVCVV